MACEKCGNTFCETWRTCNKCNPMEFSTPNPNTGEAAEKAGEGIAKFLFWLAGNKYLAFVWFWIIWMVSALIIGQSLGIVNNPDGSGDPGWFTMLTVVAPVVVAIIFRKAVMNYVPRALTYIVAFGLSAIYIAFIILIVVVAFRMFF